MELNTLVPINVSVQGFEGRIQSARANPNNLQVRIENIERNTFPIVANVVGQAADGFLIGESSATPDFISISGPETLVNNIGQVEARAQVSGISHTERVPATIHIIDRDGNSMNTALFLNNFEEEEIYVEIEVLEKRLVPIVFGEIEDVPEEYVITNISSEPGYIQVAGSVIDIRHVNEINISSASFDLDERVGIYEFTVDVRPHLPAGIMLADINANIIVVNLSIELAGTRTVELPVDTISIMNLSEDLIATIEGNGTISFVLQGEQRVIDRLDLRNRVSIDLGPFTRPGRTMVLVHVDLPSNVRLTGRVTVDVNIEDKEAREPLIEIYSGE
jgi:YbbR domain-containing protein